MTPDQRADLAGHEGGPMPETPCPWIVPEPYPSCDEDRPEVVGAVFSTDPEDPESSEDMIGEFADRDDALRAVASVNALSSFTVAEIEAGIDLAELVRERDAALSLLRRLADAGDSMNGAPLTKDATVAAVLDFDAALAAAREMLEGKTDA